MLKKFFLAAVVGLIICAGVKVEAAEVYVGTSPATNNKCYVITDTINHTYEERMIIYSATLKTVNRYGENHFIDYKFYSLDGDTENVQFVNSDGSKGIADSYETPIEWAMFLFVKDY
ncbi:MAG: hypothetical protein IJG80_06125 [Selenomonadaceae bacterium]|nr:hypothetical protein [Selenomonadaceae bacterium]